jgi:hypothetical protein
MASLSITKNSEWRIDREQGDLPFSRILRESLPELAEGVGILTCEAPTGSAALFVISVTDVRRPAVL